MIHTNTPRTSETTKEFSLTQIHDLTFNTSQFVFYMYRWVIMYGRPVPNTRPPLPFLCRFIRSHVLVGLLLRVCLEDATT